MFTSPIKSRPQYPGLRLATEARRHLLAAEGHGAAAVLRLLSGSQHDVLAKVHILYAATGSDTEEYAPKLQALGAGTFEVAGSPEDALARLHALLDQASMGTRLYAAGTEGFVGRVIALAIEHGMDHHSVITEHGGSLARRVQCVHCKGFTEGVRVSIFECGHCGTLLFVRDHYSRRLAAFQGVAVNAEEPGSRPPAEEIYL
jgi:predicted RNA-binding Zn-ribbon protein involved in translation (DUF1610 family)